MDEAREDHIGRNAVAAVDRERERDRNGTQTSSKLQAVEGLAGLGRDGQGRKGAKLRCVALCGNLFLRLKDVGNEDTS